MKHEINGKHFVAHMREAYPAHYLNVYKTLVESLDKKDICTCGLCEPTTEDEINIHEITALSLLAVAQNTLKPCLDDGPLKSKLAASWYELACDEVMREALVPTH